MTNRTELTMLTNRELAEILINSGGGCEFCSVNEENAVCERNLENCINHVVEWLTSEA